jgi:hypothetical protein
VSTDEMVYAAVKNVAGSSGSAGAMLCRPLMQRGEGIAVAGERTAGGA